MFGIAERAVAIPPVLGFNKFLYGEFCNLCFEALFLVPSA